MSKKKQKVLESKVRNIFNISEKQKRFYKKYGMYKQLSIPFPENYRHKKRAG